jgi:hypothetical protein
MFVAKRSQDEGAPWYTGASLATKTTALTAEEKGTAESQPDNDKREINGFGSGTCLKRLELGDPVGAGNYGSRTDSATTHSQETTVTRNAIKIILSAFRVMH